MQRGRIHPRGLSRRRLLALAGGAAIAAAVARRPGRVLGGAGIVRSTLGNGLLILVQARPSAGTAAVLHTTLAGVRDDGDAPGSTVLTSRMLLQGSPRFPSEIDVKRAITNLGGSIERGTTTEYSEISCVMPAGAVETAFDVISDVITNPLFSPDSFTGQQQVALSDLAQRRSSPGNVIADLFQQTLFAGQPLGFPPLGSEDSIAALTLETLQANRDRLWGAANTVLTIVGNVQPQNVLALAAEYFSGVAAGTANVRQPAVSTALASAQTVRATAGRQVQFLVGFPAPSLREADRYPLAALTSIMGGFSGRLLRVLRSDLGLSFTPSATYTPFSDAGIWNASSAVDPDKLDQALDATRAQIQLLRDTSASSSEVADAIGAISGGEILESEANSSVARQLAVQQILGDVSNDEFVRRVQAVTADDIQRVAQTYLDLDHSLTTIVGPQS
jgi:predicted Zn-dependent peptidase